MKPADISRLSPEHRDFVRDQLATRSNRPVTAVFAQTPAIEYDSGAERRYAALLTALARSDAKHWDGSTVLGWTHHTMRFRVGTTAWYEPDFAVQIREAPDESNCEDWVLPVRFRLVEVKGSWKSKNARESRAKLEAAAMLYPWFQWEAAVVKGAGFDHEVIGSR